MAQEYVLEATVRDRVGKGAARALRRENKIPAVIYGGKKPPLPIALPYKDVNLKLHAGGFLTHVWTIKVGGESIRVLPRDYQLEPVRDFLAHVDFLRITRDSRVAVEVPVHFENEEESPGLKRGGVLNIVRHTVELDCPATSIPEALTFDLTGLDIGDTIHISAVTLPDDVAPTITDRDFTVATIAAPAVTPDEEDAAAEEAAAEEAEEAAEGEGEAEGGEEEGSSDDSES
ncbi:50S ribosomal protein L25/general stress protein Ctc [Amorphus orientalis]|uniref:Large ribosomal subunit protein bL25 n=1 Tax=Amorphus orientalis TaxID=649198 RepID=A0AAE4AVG4_9HYPH|nr:50S ribosomal protein L25/general stress protein Ctc [Amorphus orientalis]MDQ0316664.1 large subunit ribosomal protein L25 [Amorphus orientalis]